MHVAFRIGGDAQKDVALVMTVAQVVVMDVD
jgi:hypothetical protein